MIPVWSPRSSWVAAFLVVLLLVVLAVASVACAPDITPDNF